MISTGIFCNISASDFYQKSESHTEKIKSILDSFLMKRAYGKKQPVMDFLFSYYSFSPSELLRYTPGMNVPISGLNHPPHKYFKSIEGGCILDASQFPFKRLSGLDWTLQLLEAINQKSPAYGCNGLHEWAMVYKSNQVRHDNTPLRLSNDEISDFVMKSTVCCSHYDAFRFFTDPAVPLNKLQPNRENRLILEQPGCLHANMDLYKWAYKYYPWVSSDIIGDAFELAVFIRDIDMRASPYNLEYAGYKPIEIETQKGRLEYLEYQREIYQKSIPVRQKLIDSLTELRNCINSDTC